MSNLLYFVAVILIITWVTGIFPGNTGNVMAITAVVLATFTDDKSQNTSV